MVKHKRPFLPFATARITALVLAAGCASACAPLGLATGPQVVQVKPVGMAAQGDAQELHAAGVAHLAGGRLGLASDTLQAALARAPRSLDTLNALAATYDLMGRFDLADRYYARALEIDPGSVATLNNYGRSHIARGKPEIAAIYLHQAARTESVHPVVVDNLNRLENLEHDLAQLKTKMPDSGSEVGAARPAPPTQWIERTGVGVVTLVTAAKGRAPALDSLWSPALTWVAADASDKGTLPVLQRRAEPGSAAVQPHPETGSVTVGAAAVPVIVANGVGRNGLADRARSRLAQLGLDVRRLANVPGFGRGQTRVIYGHGCRDRALEVAGLLPLAAEVELEPSLGRRVRIELGADWLAVDEALVLTRLASLN
jgi:tetratricopeptide (TPR) repeat protein